VSELDAYKQFTLVMREKINRSIRTGVGSLLKKWYIAASSHNSSTN
jgi:hypothetical protein